MSSRSPHESCRPWAWLIFDVRRCKPMQPQPEQSKTADILDGGRLPRGTIHRSACWRSVKTKLVLTCITPAQVCRSQAKQTFSVVDFYTAMPFQRKSRQPNKAPEPTPTSVMPRAEEG